MEKTEPNPFSVSTMSTLERGVFADHAVLKRHGFLFRVIEFNSPLSGYLTYNSWWFRQMIEINGEPCWFQISWLKLRSEFEFRVPDSIQLAPGWDAENRKMNIEISFSRTLAIRRFRIWLAGQILYDEIN